MILAERCMQYTAGIAWESWEVCQGESACFDKEWGSGETPRKGREWSLSKSENNKRLPILYFNNLSKVRLSSYHHICPPYLQYGAPEAVQWVQGGAWRRWGRTQERVLEKDRSLTPLLAGEICWSF